MVGFILAGRSTLRLSDLEIYINSARYFIITSEPKSYLKILKVSTLTPINMKRCSNIIILLFILFSRLV